MALSVRVLCRPEIAAGFELAGLRVDTAVDGVSTRVRLGALAGDPTVGIVLLEDRLQRLLPTSFMQRLEQLPRPLIAPFPSPPVAGADAAEQAVLEVLRRAIGYRVRLP